MKVPIVELYWLDCCSRGGWLTLQEMLNRSKPLPCRSVGYVVANDDERVVVAQTVNRIGQGTDRLTVPKGCVQDMTVLAEIEWEIVEDE